MVSGVALSQELRSLGKVAEPPVAEPPVAEAAPEQPGAAAVCYGQEGCAEVVEEVRVQIAGDELVLGPVSSEAAAAALCGALHIC